MTNVYIMLYVHCVLHLTTVMFWLLYWVTVKSLTPRFHLTLQTLSRWKQNWIRNHSAPSVHICCVSWSYLQLPRIFRSSPRVKFATPYGFLSFIECVNGTRVNDRRHWWPACFWSSYWIASTCVIIFASGHMWGVKRDPRWCKQGCGGCQECFWRGSME